MIIPRMYPKCENLFKRWESGALRGKIIPGEFKNPLFKILRPDFAWKFTEKIDGTNIRIFCKLHSQEENSSVNLNNPGEQSPQWHLGGRTNNAQIQGQLVQAINQLMETTWPLVCEKLQSNVIFYGEGYGAGIQKGGGYRDTPSFILFDIQDADTGYFYKWSAVQGLGEALGFDVVPELPEIYSMTDVVNAVRNGFNTLVGKKEAKAEGVVARCEPDLYHFSGGFYRPLRWKLKTKDFADE